MENDRRVKTNHQFVRDAVRAAILAGSFPAGKRLVIADIASQFDVSSTPVREALRDLQAEGLVTMDAFRGAAVASLDRGELFEVYEALTALEPLVIRRAVGRLAPGELNDAAELLVSMEKCSDASEFVALDNRFHEIYAAKARAPRLQAMITSLRNGVGPYVAAMFRETPSSVPVIVKCHRRFLDAVRADDTDSAVAAELEYLRELYQHWVQAASDNAG